MANGADEQAERVEGSPKEGITFYQENNYKEKNMNLNKIFKQVTGIALAATLFTGGISTAFAAATPTVPSGADQALTAAPSITKEVSGGYFGGGTFNYTITPTTAPAYTGYTPRTSDSPLISLTDSEIEIAAGETTGTEAITVNQAAVDKAQPGVYRYQIKEKASGIAGMTDDTRTFDVDVFVTSDNGTGRKIAYYIVSVAGQKAELKFTNTLALKDLTVSKVVTGNQADLSDEFNFSFTVTPASGTTNTSVRYNYDGKENQVVKTGEAVNLEGVGNGDKFVITGLAEGDSVTITETDTQNRGYTTTYKVDNGTAQDGTSASVTGKNSTVEFTNTRTAEIPTGLIENIGPFVIAILAAGFILFIYFKNNKKEEELA